MACGPDTLRVVPGRGWNDDDPDLANEIWSPVIDWTRDIYGNPVDAGATRTLLQFRVYRNLTLEGAVLYTRADCPLCFSMKREASRLARSEVAERQTDRGDRVTVLTLSSNVRLRPGLEAGRARIAVRTDLVPQRLLLHLVLHPLDQGRPAPVLRHLRFFLEDEAFELADAQLGHEELDPRAGPVLQMRTCYASLALFRLRMYKLLMAMTTISTM